MKPVPSWVATLGASCSGCDWALKETETLPLPITDKQNSSQAAHPLVSGCASDGTPSHKRCSLPAEEAQQLGRMFVQEDNKRRAGAMPKLGINTQEHTGTQRKSNQPCPQPTYTHRLFISYFFFFFFPSNGSISSSPSSHLPPPLPGEIPVYTNEEILNKRIGSRHRH